MPYQYGIQQESTRNVILMGSNIETVYQMLETGAVVKIKPAKCACMLIKWFLNFTYLEIKGVICSLIHGTWYERNSN
jgi:hypothetical protein